MLPAIAAPFAFKQKINFISNKSQFAIYLNFSTTFTAVVSNIISGPDMVPKMFS